MEDNEQFGQTPTLRDQFAMAALAGLLGSEAAHGPFMKGNPTAAAVFCFEVADAMLAERDK